MNTSNHTNTNHINHTISIKNKLTIMPPKTIKKFNFKIGADPEFVLTMQNRKVDAKQTMELMLSKKEGFKLTPDGFDIDPYGNIGWDGAASTAEIRPRPSFDPKEVTNNIAGIFKAFIKHIKMCDMSTISEFSSVGGHIHLEIPKGDKWSNEKRNIIQRRFSSFYLPILIAENKTNLNLRIKQNYGSLKDNRIEERFKYEDGTPGFTFEFRCPSAEWLTTPKLAEATMAYFGVIYHEILNHPKNFIKYNDIIYKNDKQGDALQTLALMEFDLLTNSILNRAKKYVRTFEMYPEYKDEIEYIFNPKQVVKDKQKVNYNIALGWNLTEKTMIPTKSQIFSSKKRIQEIAKNEDFDLIKRIMNIHYNDDTNVALFAENFKDKVAAFNWKLKNNYFIFGMRKGITDIIAKNLKGEYLIGEQILETIMDREQVDRLFEKMNQKFNNQENLIRGTTIDFLTGKAKDLRETIIMIGLPYEMRVKEDVRPFLDFIWSLEKGLIQDSKKEEKGEIYKILTKKTETPQVILDNGSQSLVNHEKAVIQMIDENINE